MLRVAANEYPTTAWACVDAGAAASPYLAERGQLAQAGAAHLAISDMYGLALHCGVMKAPKLVVREPYMAPGKKVTTGKAIAHAFSERTGSIVVTGGLGALGTVVAVWLATDGGYDLWLLGRSGRSGEQLPEEIYSSTAQVHCAKCDVSAVEEASYIVAAASASGKVLRSIMHAGAVLDSKVISNISAASIRTEYSGTSTWTACFWVWQRCMHLSHSHPTSFTCRQGFWGAPPSPPERFLSPQFAPSVFVISCLQWRCRPGQLCCSQWRP